MLGYVLFHHYIYSSARIEKNMRRMQQANICDYFSHHGFDLWLNAVERTHVDTRSGLDYLVSRVFPNVKQI